MEKAQKSYKPGTNRRLNAFLSALFTLIAIVYVMPIVIVLINSFKESTAITTSPFSLPTGVGFVAFRNYVEGIVSGNYPFYKAVVYSVIITVLSSAAILICTSMCAWYIVRVKSAPSKLFYYLCFTFLNIFRNFIYDAHIFFPSSFKIISLLNPLQHGTLQVYFRGGRRA